MKSIIIRIFSLLSLMPIVLQAQIDRSNPPKPLPAGLIKIGTPATFTLPNGLKVFVVNSTKLPKISATLTLDVGAILEGDKAGYVSMAGQMMMRGTKTKTKAQLDEEIDMLGSNISAGSSYVSGSALTSNFNKVMALMAEIALNPSFQKEELEKIRKQTLSGLEQAKESPDNIASNVSKKIAYGANHAYGEVETEQSVKKITLDDVKKYYATYWKPNIGYLVFVGDINVESARKLATTYFGNWVKGTVTKAAIPFPAPNKQPLIAIVDRPQSVQSTISIISTIQLKPGDPNVIPARITASILGGGASGRLYKNLRETRAFTYGAYSSISSDKNVGTFTAGASVRNEKTDSAIGEFLVEFNKIKKQPATDDEVSMVKKEITGSFSRSLEQPSTIANFALSAAINKLPADYYQKYVTNISEVNAAKVQQIANNYIKNNNLVIVVVGNASQVAEGLEKYGEVKYFDIYGNPTNPPTKGKAVDPSITGESIIAKHITAVGGSAVIETLKDVVVTGDAKIPGAPMDFAVNQKYLLSNNFSMTMAAGPMVVMKQGVKAGECYQEQQGQKQTLNEEDKEEILEETTFVNEIYYLKNKYTFTPKAIEVLDGNEVYVVEIKSQKGRIFTNYYDVVTGLKAKMTKVIDADGKKMSMGNTFSDYQTFEGIKVPMKTIMDIGIKISINYKDVKINTGLKVEEF